MRPRLVEANVFVTILVLLANQSDVFAARYVPIEVRLNGVVLLKGNDSDGGRRDFDQVWNNLHTVQLQSTEEFNKRYVKEDTKEVVLESTNKDAEKSDLVIDDSCGGDAHTRTLRIHRVNPDRFGNEWMLDNVQLKELFYEREMQREQVAELVRPGRDGRDWVLDNVQLKGLYSERETPRERVAELVKPGRDGLLKPDDGKKRSVAISVSANNVVLLDGSDDDDGRRDADAVWDNLPNVRLKASEAFLKNYVTEDATVAQAVCRLKVSYGGTTGDRTFLMMIRVKPDEFGREWMLDPKYVKNEFEFRTISRELASHLKNPKRSR